ncbi:MAG: hypothetical protein ACJZ86_00865 [Pontiellaceae bacterium]
MVEPSLSSVLAGLESYLAYEKLQGVTRVEMNQAVRDSLLEEVDLSVIRASEGKTLEAPLLPDTLKELFVVEGLSNMPAILFLCEESEAASVYADEQGALLSRMIKAMEQTEDQVGVVRLPSNLKNGVDEMGSLFEEVSPRSCVVFGGTILEHLLGKRVAFESMRGRWIELNGVRLMPTHALSHMLKSPSVKKETWQDLQRVMEYLK